MKKKFDDLNKEQMILASAVMLSVSGYAHRDREGVTMLKKMEEAVEVLEFLARDNRAEVEKHHG